MCPIGFRGFWKRTVRRHSICEDSTTECRVPRSLFWPLWPWAPRTPGCPTKSDARRSPTGRSTRPVTPSPPTTSCSTPKRWVRTEAFTESVTERCVNGFYFFCFLFSLQYRNPRPTGRARPSSTAPCRNSSWRISAESTWCSSFIRSICECLLSCPPAVHRRAVVVVVVTFVVVGSQHVCLSDRDIGFQRPYRWVQNDRGRSRGCVRRLSFYPFGLGEHAA